MSLSKHDEFWSNKLLVPSVKGIHISNKGHWDRKKFGDEDTVGFLYSSNDILIIDFKDEVMNFTSDNIKNLKLGIGIDDIINIFDLNEFEVDCDDIDFFRTSTVEYNLDSNIIVKKVFEINSDISYFIESQTKKDINISAIDDEFDVYYLAYFQDELVALSGVFKAASSYYHSLSIITDKTHRKKGFGKSLLSYISEDIEKENGVLCFRVNRDNFSSINLCKSCGFQEVSRIQTLSIIR